MNSGSLGLNGFFDFDSTAIVIDFMLAVTVIPV